MSTYSPRLVANAFLFKAQQAGAQVTHMKLQKLVFFVHAWSLAIHGESFVDERPEAWQYGPVFDSLYHELKAYGPRNIDAFLLQMDQQTGERKALIPVLTDTTFWSLLEQVWDRYSRFSAMQLSALTHEPDSPWDQARKTGSGWLRDDAVQSFYRKQIEHVS